MSHPIESQNQTVQGDGRGIALTSSVVICAYTERRWDVLVEAIESVLAQSPSPGRVVVVIDHNDALLDRVRERFAGADVQIVPNEGNRGLSGARNTGLGYSQEDVVVFLDDDAV